MHMQMHMHVHMHTHTHDARAGRTRRQPGQHRAALRRRKRTHTHRRLSAVWFCFLSLFFIFFLFFYAAAERHEHISSAFLSVLCLHNENMIVYDVFCDRVFRLYYCPLSILLSSVYITVPCSLFAHRTHSHTQQTQRTFCSLFLFPSFFFFGVEGLG